MEKLLRITDNDYYPWREKAVTTKRFQNCTERLLNRQAQLEADQKEHKAVIRELVNTLHMVREELIFGGNWEDAKANIDRKVQKYGGE